MRTDEERMEDLFCLVAIQDQLFEFIKNYSQTEQGEMHPWVATTVDLTLSELVAAIGRTTTILLGAYEIKLDDFNQYLKEFHGHSGVTPITEALKEKPTIH